MFWKCNYRKIVFTSFLPIKGFIWGFIGLIILALSIDGHAVIRAFSETYKGVGHSKGKSLDITFDPENDVFFVTNPELIMSKYTPGILIPQESGSIASVVNWPDLLMFLMNIQQHQLQIWGSNTKSKGIFPNIRFNANDVLFGRYSAYEFQYVRQRNLRNHSDVVRFIYQSANTEPERQIFIDLRRLDAGTLVDPHTEHLQTNTQDPYIYTIEGFYFASNNIIEDGYETEEHHNRRNEALAALNSNRDNAHKPDNPPSVDKREDSSHIRHPKSGQHYFTGGNGSGGGVTGSALSSALLSMYMIMKWEKTP